MAEGRHREWERRALQALQVGQVELLLGGLLELERQALPASMPVLAPASFRCVRRQAGHRHWVLFFPRVEQFRLMSG